jgi:hypothetical protein
MIKGTEFKKGNTLYRANIDRKYEMIKKGKIAHFLEEKKNTSI